MMQSVPIRQSNDNNISGHYFRHYFPCSLSQPFLIERIVELKKVDLTNDKIAKVKRGYNKIALKVCKVVTPKYLRRLYESMPRRMAADIASQGGHTTY